jgi:predicted ATPase
MVGYGLRGFKGFIDAQVRLAPGLSVLIGPNGVGKTNLIEGLELLAYVASGRPIHAITDIGRGGALEVRGGLQSCARRGQETFELSFRASLPFEGKAQTAEYRVSLRALPAQEIEAESLIVGERTFFAAQRGAPGLLDVTWDNFKRGPNKPTATIAAGQAALSQYATFASTNAKLKDCLEVIGAVRASLEQSFMFDPHPRLMRGYERVGNAVLQRDGANLSAVLFALSEGTPAQREALDRLARRIARIPEERFTAFGFERTRLNDVLFGLKNAAGVLTDARLLSDGTLRALAVLTALETCPPQARIVVEEFDNGVHPSRVRALLEALLDDSKRRALNVLVTTHNPATLDAMPPEDWRAVIVAYWDGASESARVVPLLELPRAGELLESGQLGDLVTRRVLESYLSPPSAEQRSVQVQRWLEALP